MTSNFDFLEAEWRPLFAEARDAERRMHGEPRASCIYARSALELALTWMYHADRKLQAPSSDNLDAMIREPSMRQTAGRDLIAKMHNVRRLGNYAAHPTGQHRREHGVQAVNELFHVTYWMARRYTRDPSNLPDQRRAFDRAVVPKPEEVRARRQSEIDTLVRQLEQQNAALEAEQRRATERQAELEQLHHQIATITSSNERRPDNHDYDEATTRDLYIDGLLHEAGWPLDQPRDREFKVTGMPPDDGTGFVDYVLWGDDGNPLAVVEAKRTRRDATAGQQQARIYADCLERQYGQRPVIFYTNGYETWLWDDTRYPPRRVEGFYTKDELALLIQRRTTRTPLAETTIDGDIVGRHYQQRAVRSIDAAFEVEKRRSALIVMATGAGKTRTVIALVEQLMRANWARRVLFLADRQALVRQATAEFRSRLSSVTTVNLLADSTAEGRVYVSTYPTMMNLINQTGGGTRRFGPGHFDLVVIDEAHRSVYQKYRAIFDYFDALLIGLTATPKDEVDRNTYRLFDLEDGVPTDYYDLEDAVAEGYLVPMQATSVPLRFQRQGIRYDELSEDDKDKWDALEWDTAGGGDAPDHVDPEAVNRWLFNADTVDQVLKTLMEHGHTVAGGDRLGKTIIFAKNNAHAQFIVERFDASYPELAGTFARTVTYQVEHSDVLIENFAEASESPHIAVSVDMLDTGVDVPEVVNLVFFKLVRSKSKFWQMIGRGTRLCADLYGPGQDKRDFKVFDFCQNLEYFNQDPATVDTPLPPSLSQRLFSARVALLADFDRRAVQPEAGGAGLTSEAGVRSDIAEHLQRIVAGMSTDNFVVRPHRKFVEKYSDVDYWYPITPEVEAELNEHVAGLPSTIRDDDERAKRFDLLVLRTQLAHLQLAPAYDRLRTRIQEIAATLLEQTRVPDIARQQELLDEVAGDLWWQDVTVPMLELVRRRVRGLVGVIERRKQSLVYTDFADEIGEMTEVQLPPMRVGTDYQRFLAKVRGFLRSHEEHVALQKLRRNRQLTDSDIEELEQMLLDSGVGERADLQRAAEEANGIGLFIRSLIGLDREAATREFSVYLRDTAYSAQQIRFIEEIVRHLTQSGVMRRDRLYESPFTDLAPHGPEDLFEDADVSRILSTLDAVTATARPDETVA